MTRPNWRKWLQGGLIASLWFIVSARIQQEQWSKWRTIAAHLAAAVAALLLIGWLLYRYLFEK